MKIISLVPSQTELLVDLGLEKHIVGVTKFCVHPNHLKENKTIVGGTKTVNFKKIKSLKPDFILCNKEENTQEIVFECEKIAKTHVSDLITIQDTLKLIEEYGVLFTCEAKAHSLIDEINFKLADFNQFIKDKPILKVAYFIWKNPWMVAANNTFINHLLTINRFENIYANLERYPEVDLKNIQKDGNPDLILLSSEPFPFKEKHTIEIEAYTKNAKTILVDGEMFSWYGSRLILAFDYFKKLRNSI